MKHTFKIIGYVLVFLLSACTDEIDNERTLGIYQREVRFHSTIISDDAFTRGIPAASVNGLQNLSIYGYYTGNGSDNDWSSAYTTAVPNFFSGQ